MKKMLFYPGEPTLRNSVGLLALRIAAGIFFMHHGWGKIQNPMHWAGDNYPGVLQALAAISEFGGGLAWILGLLTPVASAGILCTMAFAVQHHMAKDGLKSMTWDTAALCGGIAVLLMLNGAGMFSADRYLFGKEK